MSFLKNLVAGAAAVAVYKLVDHGLRKLERDILDRDVPLDDDVPAAAKDAIVVAGSRLDHIPTVSERDAIARGLNFAGSVLTTALFLEVKGVFLHNEDEEEAKELEQDWVRSLLITAGIFVLSDLVAKPALGMSEPTGRQRRFISHMASKGTQHAVRRLLA
jgi:hypothetical protein